MADKRYEENDVLAIANAIRYKNGTENTYTVAEMPQAIRSIQTGSTGTDTSDAQIDIVTTGADGRYYSPRIVEGCSAYAQDRKIYGSLQSLSGETIPSSNHLIAMSGDDLVKASFAVGEVDGEEFSGWLETVDRVKVELPVDKVRSAVTADATLNSGALMVSGYSAYSGGQKYEGTINDATGGSFDFDSAEENGNYIAVSFSYEDTMYLPAGHSAKAYIPKSQLEPFFGGWTKVAEKTIQNQTTSTSAANISTLTVSGLYNADRVMVRITDTAGRRNGYFYQHEDYFRNYYHENGATTTLTYGARIGLMINSSGNLVEYVGATTTAYGVYAYSITSAGVLQIRSRYNANYSGTINGNYLIEVFTYSTP